MPRRRPVPPVRAVRGRDERLATVAEHLVSVPPQGGIALGGWENPGLRGDPALLLDPFGARPAPCGPLDVMPRARRELDGQQPLEQGPIAPQPLAEVLGRDLSRLPCRLELLTLAGEHPRQPVHHVHDEGVGVLDRPSRLVHEPGLDLLPAGHEALLLAIAGQLVMRFLAGAGTAVLVARYPGRGFRQRVCAGRRFRHGVMAHVLHQRVVLVHPFRQRVVVHVLHQRVVPVDPPGLAGALFQRGLPGLAVAPVALSARHRWSPSSVACPPRAGWLMGSPLACSSLTGWPLVGRAGPGPAGTSAWPSGRSSSSNSERYRSSASRRSSVLACWCRARSWIPCATR